MKITLFLLSYLITNLFFKKFKDVRVISFINLNIFSYFQNGYPARRRSLVDDARFESIVVKQTKQSVLEEARNRADGKRCSPKQANK